MSPRDVTRAEQAENARHRVDDLKRSYRPISGKIVWRPALIGGLSLVAAAIVYLAVR